jgi:hypothetical protein
MVMAFPKKKILLTFIAKQMYENIFFDWNLIEKHLIYKFS